MANGSTTIDRRGAASGCESDVTAATAGTEGDFVTGLKLYDEAFRSLQQAGDKPDMAAVTGNTGNLLRAQGKLEDAVAHYQKALASGHPRNPELEKMLEATKLADKSQ